ncbi:MAG: ATP-dependent RNA helicase HrpA [Ilumatobacteraceae bacterium]
MPIAERRDDLMAALRDHQVVVVAGETGSGKSTQLPKLCLDVGRGTNGLIGHTQPRRVAARTIAERIADETGTPLGGLVGYSVRFTDRVGPDTRVRVMTDGILLAEVQRDPMLRRYDTLIIDEAHERSLTIDFLLGYLRRLLPDRPDLTVVVTSATIDTARFAAHFAGPDGPAPVIEVSGRTFPVEVRYRPFGTEPDDDRDQVQAVVDAVDELGTEGDGDVLVFLSGEREIHDTADALRRHATERPGHLEVLPLYARLSAVEQHRIFEPHAGRRVVLSTNVAETSLTVPGVRYVVDAGTARLSRYSHRLKVQRLPIEAVSQASADQRAGRCGRVAPGICVRLYDEADYAERPRFTEPEILRTSLASVILQMTALGLGEVADFPFLDPPDARSVRDGYALLEELGAIEPDTDRRGNGRRLTRLGRRLARLPVDPRLGRMVLEAERHGCVREVMVIAAALSIQDPRERPTEHRAAADELHRRFDVPGSDLLGLVKLWDYLRERQAELSGNQFRRMCRDEYLHYLRVREWQDLFSQLRQVAGQLGVRSGTDAGHPDRVHQSVLSGMLSHLGMRDGLSREYRGAHGARFALFPGTALSTSLPKWVVAAELVETTRLWGRVAAEVRPEWAEHLAPHLVRRSYGDPWWDARRGGAVCREQVTLYGLPIANRVVGLEKVDPGAAREHFIRCALVEGDWETTQPVIERNRRFLAELGELGERVRRVDLVDEAAVHAFYDSRLGPEVTSGRHFDRWWKAARARDPDLLTMTRERLAGSTAVPAPDDFPTTWQQGDLVLPIEYRFDPGTPHDGATVLVPLVHLGRLGEDGIDWHVRGMRDDIVEALLREAPKEYRRQLVPMADVIAAVQQAVRAEVPVSEPIADVVARIVAEQTGVTVPARSLRAVTLPDHLRRRFAAGDEQGAVVDSDRSLSALRERLAPVARRAVARATPFDERRNITTWDLGDLPPVIESGNGAVVRGFPALVDDGDSVSVRVLSSDRFQSRVQHGGVRRLLLLTVPVSRRALRARLSNDVALAVASAGFDLDDLGAHCLVAAADDLLHEVGRPVFAAADFDTLVATARDRLAAIAAEALALAGEVCVAAVSVRRRLERLVAPPVALAARDAQSHLDRLVRPGFPATAGTARLADVVRYVRGIDHRLSRLPENPQRDARGMNEVVPVESAYRALLSSCGREVPRDVVDLGWQLEELRVATFAQALGAARGTSRARLLAAISALADREP